TNYNPFGHLMNIHSWYYLFSSTSANIGLYSNDLLNTAAINTELNFNANEKAFSIGSEICYAGFYPILSAGVNLGQRISYTGEIFDEFEIETWNEAVFSLRADLPLNYSTGVFYRQLKLSLSGAYTYISDKKTIGTYENGNGWFVPFSYGIAYQNYQDPAPRDVKPTAGFTTQINVKHTPLGGDYQSRLYAIQGNYYLPGFIKHHSLMFDAKFERQNPSNYRFVSPIAFAKGYDHVYYDLFTGAGITYEFPLGYPDWALGGLFYLKRIRGAFFGDFNLGKTGELERQYNSIGVDLNFDFNIFSLVLELNAGVRIAYRFTENDLNVSLLMLGMEF
ncbi:MAG: hypothetical protein PHC43_04130, partial [Candidatus Marinimicrobia bacterium]|nr:hypothetical protein [Candidatus Neomarinimicrobiota bacterium]